jgi:hypothetical protein
MVARLYLSGLSGSAVSPAFSSVWNKTTGAVRKSALGVPNDSNFGSASNNEVSATPTNVLVDQFVSSPITVGKTISGTFTATTQARAGAGNDGCYLRVVVRVVSGDGLTVRGTLLNALSTSQLNAGTALPASTVTGTVTPVVALAGDRIVIERGGWFDNISTSTKTITLTDGAPFGWPDLEVGGGGGFSVAWLPWFEFSQDDIWAPVKRRVSAMSSSVLVDPPRSPILVSAAEAQVLVDLSRTPTLVSSAQVDVLRSVNGDYRIRGIYGVGTNDVSPLMLWPDGLWRVIEPWGPDTGWTVAPMHVFSSGVSSLSTNSTTTSGYVPSPDDLVVYCTFTATGFAVTAPAMPVGLGATWELVHASPDLRRHVWLGRNPTTAGTITSPYAANQANSQTVVHVVRGVSSLRQLADGWSPAATPAVPLSLSVAPMRRGNIALYAGMSGTTKTPSWESADAQYGWFGVGAGGGIGEGYARVELLAPRLENTQIATAHTAGSMGTLLLLE